MANLKNSHNINRRDFLKLGGGFAAALAGGSLLRNVLHPADVFAQVPPITFTHGRDYSLAATDGWAYMPSTAPQVPPSGQPCGRMILPRLHSMSTLFGFRNVDGLTQDQIFSQKEKAQISAPMLVMDEGKETFLTLYQPGPGLAPRPDRLAHGSLPRLSRTPFQCSMVSQRPPWLYRSVEA